VLLLKYLEEVQAHRLFVKQVSLFLLLITIVKTASTTKKAVGAPIWKIQWSVGEEVRSYEFQVLVAYSQRV
jgi:hypothetical protein